MKDFLHILLDYHILVAGLFVAYLYAHSFYVEFFTKKSVRDDWWETRSYFLLAKRYRRGHEDFVGSNINLSTDISMVYRDGDNHGRIFKE